jgi:hypothetical protein
MKNTYLNFFVIIMFSLASCSRGYSPKSVAANFLNAFSQKKFEEAKKYCTPETVKLVEVAESLSKMSSVKTDFTGKQYEVLSQEIHGESAKVKFKEKGSEEIQEITLKNTGTEWLVSVSKEDVMSKQNMDRDVDSQADTLKTGY